MCGQKIMSGWGYMANQLVVKETGAYSPLKIFKNAQETIDFYLLYENAYRVIKKVTSDHELGEPQGNFKIRSYELVIPPSVKEYVDNTKISSVKTKNIVYSNNSNERNIVMTNLIIGKTRLKLENFLDFNNIDKSDYSKLTFLGKKNLNEIQNNSSLNMALEQATNSEIEFIN